MWQFVPSCFSTCFTCLASIIGRNTNETSWDSNEGARQFKANQYVSESESLFHWHRNASIIPLSHWGRWEIFSIHVVNRRTMSFSIFVVCILEKKEVAHSDRTEAFTWSTIWSSTSWHSTFTPGTLMDFSIIREVRSSTWSLVVKESSYV